MKMYSYPIGATFVGDNTTLVTRENSLARPVVINEIQYGMDIFENWTPEQLSELGIKEFIEDAVTEHCQGGVPVDVEAATQVHRTYPNSVFEPAPWRAKLMNDIQAKKIVKRDGGFTVDGVLFDSDTSANVQYLNFFTQVMSNPTYTVANWKASNVTWVEMDAVLFAKVSAAFGLNTAAAFDWQASMQTALDAAPDTYEALKAIEDQINGA